MLLRRFSDMLVGQQTLLSTMGTEDFREKVDEDHGTNMSNQTRSSRYNDQTSGAKSFERFPSSLRHIHLSYVHHPICRVPPSAFFCDVKTYGGKCLHTHDTFLSARYSRLVTFSIHDQIKRDGKDLSASFENGR